MEERRQSAISTDLDDLASKSAKTPSIVVDHCQELTLSSDRRGDENVQRKPLAHHFIGIALMLLASLVFQINGVIYKILLKHHHVLFLTFCRATLLLCFSSAVLLVRRVNPFDLPLLRRHWPLLLSRSLLGVFGIVTLLTSLDLIPIGEAMSLAFTTPIFVAIFAKILLAERYSVFYALAAILAIAGCLLIMRPPFLFGGHQVEISLAKRIVGTLTALGFAVSSAYTYILFRKLRLVDSTVVVFIYGVISAPLTGGGAVAVNVVDVPDQWLTYVLLFLIGVTSTISQTCQTAAAKFEDPNVCSLLRTCDLLWAFLFQVAIFGNVPSWTSAAGCALVGAGVLLVGVKKVIDVLKHSMEAFQTTLGGRASDTTLRLLDSN